MGFLGWLVEKNLPANAGDVGFTLGREEPLHEVIATHSSMLAWEIPWTESLAGCGPWDHKRVGQDPATEHSNTNLSETYRNVICLISAHFKDF